MDSWNYTTIAPDPYYQAPGMSTPTYAIGTSGIPFGGFTPQNQPETFPQATSAPTDSGGYNGELGFSYTQPAAVTTPTPAPYTYTAPTYTTTNAPQQNAQFAQSILDALPDPQKINSYQFNKLKKSTQDVALAGYAAKGYDPNDVSQTINDILPKGAMSSRGQGYFAPLASTSN